MELPGAAYLYALAELSITFSGFSALLVVLRQTSGGMISPLDVFIIVIYFLTGFAIALVCLLPPLLSGWSSNVVVSWRVSSGIAAVLGIGVEIFGLVRRRSATPGDPTPGLRIVMLLLYWPAFLLLALSACDIWVRPGFGPYAASLTWVFMMAGIDFMTAVHIIFRTRPQS